MSKFGATCNQCQSKISTDVKFCTSCGAPVETSVAARGQTNPRVHTGAAKKLPKSVMIKAITKSVTKSLLLAAVLLAPGMALLISGMTFAGMMCLFFGSFILMAKTYRKPWRLGLISCILPPLTAGLCYALQLALFKQAAPMPILLSAIAAGLLIGLIRARSHNVTKDDKGSIIAQRTFGYLLIWVIAYGATQGFGYFARDSLAVRAGLVTGAFSTAMLAMVSVVIWSRYRKVRSVVMLLTASLFVATANVSDVMAAEIDCQSLRNTFTNSASNLPVLRDYPQADRVKEHSFENCEFSQDFSARNGDKIEVRLSVEPFQSVTDAQNELLGYLSGLERVSANGDIGAAFATNPIYDPKYHHMFIMSTKGSSLLTSKISFDYTSRNNNPNRQAQKGDLVRLHNLLYNQTQSTSGTTSTDIPPGTRPRPSKPSAIPQLVGGEPTTNAEQEEIIAVTAAVIAALVAAGIAVNVAQAIAAALAQALQAGTQMTAEDLQNALLDALADDETDASPPEGPPIPPPTIYFAEGDPFLTNEHGEYFVPDKNGDWAWRSEAEARDFETRWRADRARVYAAQNAESAARETDQRDAMRRSGEKMRAQDDETRAQEQRAKAESQARRNRINEDAQKPDPRSAPGYDPQFTTTAGEVGTFLGDWIMGMGKDNLDLITQTPGALVEAAASAASSAAKVILNPDNWKAVGNLGADAIGSHLGHQGSQARINARAAIAAKIVGKLTAQGIKAGLNDPLGSAGAVIGGIIGFENWKDSVNGDIPVTGRVGRVLWGAVDLGGLVHGAVTGAGKAAGKVGNALRVLDSTGDAGRGARAMDAAGDAVRAGDGATDAIRASEAYADARRRGLSHNGARRHAEAVGDKVQTAEQAARAQKTRSAGAAARKGNVKPGSIDELRDNLRAQKRGGVADPGSGKNVERYGIPDSNLDPEGHVRALPQGAILDRNTASEATGWSGHAIDDMGRMTRQENVIVTARTTNVHSMRHIRDGTAIPKPLDIKAKTIGDLDVWLGAKKDDRGLVGFFNPNEPPKKLSAYMPDGLKRGTPEFDDAVERAQKLRDKVIDRYKTRLEEQIDLRGKVKTMIDEGKVIERDGKLFAVVKDANGTTRHMPYAGDIDGVMFRNATPPHAPLKGADYRRAKLAYMGGTPPDEAAKLAAAGRHDEIVPNYFARSKSPGQHGVEANIIPDFVEGKDPNSSGFDKARQQAIGVHTKLEKNHPDEITVDIYGSVLKRGETFGPKGTRLPRYEDTVSAS